MKRILIIIFCLMPNILFSQNITMTLGSGGTLTVWDGSSTFLTLRQSDGQLNPLRSMRLENTIDATGNGVIYKGFERFIHDYMPAPYTSYNTFVGSTSGNFTMTSAANYNTALGKFTLYRNYSGANNTAIGSGSMSQNETGYNNTSVGSGSSQSIINGYNNTAVGFYSYAGNVYGQHNTAMGSYSLFSYQNTGSYNTAIGSYSMYSNSSGTSNTALGYYSLYSNTTGTENTASGLNSLRFNSSGWSNTAYGLNSLLYNSSGWQNTAVGHHALQNNNGNYNTALGYNSGSSVTSGFNLTLLGIDANPTSPTAGNQITLGNGFVTSLRCNVTTITSLSDARDKKNIQDLSLGLDFIAKLKPRQFNWDKREWYDENVSDGSKMLEVPTAGFIAQELDEAQTSENAEWLNLVLKDNPEKWEATAGNLLPVMVKAIQELKAENDELKAQVESLKNVEERLVKLEKLIRKNNDLKEVKLGGEK
jgi:hypothetical protein